MQRASIVLMLLLAANVAIVVADDAAAGTGVCPDGHKCCGRSKNGVCTSKCLEARYACPQQGGTGGGHIKMRKLKAAQVPLIADVPMVVDGAQQNEKAQKVKPALLAKKDAPADEPALLAKKDAPADEPALLAKKDALAKEPALLAEKDAPANERALLDKEPALLTKKDVPANEATLIAMKARLQELQDLLDTYAAKDALASVQRRTEGV